MSKQTDERYMIDLDTYQSLHKDNVFEGMGYRRGLAHDVLGPEAMSHDECPDD